MYMQEKLGTVRTIGYVIAVVVIIVVVLLRLLPHGH
jgi:hypothetical protein